MKTSRIFLLGILIISIFILSCKNSSEPGGDSNFSLKLSPETANIELYDDLILSLEVEGVNDMFLIGFNLMYDRSMLYLSEVTIPSSCMLGDDCLDFMEEITGGISVSVGRAQTDGNDNVSGDGVLCEFSFLCIATGSCQVELEEVSILDEDGNTNTQISNSNVKSAEITIN